MAELQACDVYLVGSLAVPSDTVEEAMGIAAERLGERLCGLPDGEVGPRAYWVAGLPITTYRGHPQLTEVAEDPATTPPLRRADGPFGRMPEYRSTGPVDFEGHLPYADAAIASYERFRALGLPPEVRFQVALPTPLAAIATFFDDPSDWPALYAAYRRAIAAEIGRILEVVPARELSIQWDYCTEICDIVGTATGRRELEEFMPWMPPGTAAERLAAHTAAEYVAPLADGIPDEVRFGYHVCLGTFPQFPTVATDDLEWVVRAANALVASTPRRVDVVQLPATADAGRDFFAPLAELDVGGARVFLGIGQRDGAEAIATRGRAAREFLPDFGISHYCGYGRDDRTRVGELLGDLRAGADLLAEDRLPDA